MRTERTIGIWQRHWPWLFAALGLALDCAAFWPGLMSFDSAQAWWQARHDAMNGITPPVFVLALRLSDWLGAGPAGVFALHLLLFWSGLALLASALRWRPLTGCIALLVIALSPLPWLLRAHVWTDVGLLAAATCTVGLLAQAQVAQRRAPWLLASLPCLAYAALLRHNALPAVAPLLLWWSTLVWPAASAARHRLPRIFVSGGVLFAALFALGSALDAQVRERIPVWPSLAQFDLAGMSVRTHRMLLPDFMIGPGLDVDELAAAFRPWSNLSLFTTRDGIRSPFTPPLSGAELEQLRSAWLDAIAHYPRAWLAHRRAVTHALVGTHPRDWPAGLIYVDTPTRYGDNPSLATSDGALHRGLMHAADALRATPALAAWPYLLCGLCAALIAWRRRAARSTCIAWITLASATLLFLPLFALAPSAEVRYLGWPCVASLLALACALVPTTTDAR
ncbi:MAG: hypothetical protein IT467_10160 [Dokdonella sp.]|uniref:hypothetical protein n=1 Tax=Dokdonella sp. TaxID=2291710 RepID=UPI0025BE73F6|nr:hypothetical protein [Dokdonella sp.]MBZ0222197.1 hypothetical protein [Dokdonella sp.]MCC7256276.1 hypothetical protein [Dokdonella sp.]